MDYFAVSSWKPATLLTQIAGIVEAFEVSQSCYALLDLAFDHGGKTMTLPDSMVYPIYHQGRLEALSQASPALFELNIRDTRILEKQLARLLHHCNGRPMLSFLATPLDAETLRERWQGCLEVGTSDGTSYLLRFADTRLLPVLTALDEIWRRLSAPVAAWWIIGRDGQLAELKLPEAPIADDEPPSLDDGDYFALLRAGAADALAGQLYEHFPDLMEGRNGAGNHALLEQLLAFCDAHLVDGSTTQYTLAVALLLTDGRLLSHPDFDSWFSKQHWSEGGLEEALGEFIDAKELA